MSQKRASPKVGVESIRHPDKRDLWFVLSANSRNLSASLPACAYYGSAKLQEPLGRGRFVGSGALVLGVCLIDPWVA